MKSRRFRRRVGQLSSQVLSMGSTDFSNWIAKQVAKLVSEWYVEGAPLEDEVRLEELSEYFSAMGSGTEFQSRLADLVEDEIVDIGIWLED